MTKKTGRRESNRFFRRLSLSRNLLVKKPPFLVLQMGSTSVFTSEMSCDDCAILSPAKNLLEKLINKMLMMTRISRKVVTQYLRPLSFLEILRPSSRHAPVLLLVYLLWCGCTSYSPKTFHGELFIPTVSLNFGLTDANHSEWAFAINWRKAVPEVFVGDYDRVGRRFMPRFHLLTTSTSDRISQLLAGTHVVGKKVPIIFTYNLRPLSFGPSVPDSIGSFVKDLTNRLNALDIAYEDVSDDVSWAYAEGFHVTP